MTAEQWQIVKDVLRKARNLDAAGRSAFLDEACGTDTRMRVLVEELLASDRATSDFLAASALSSDTRPDAAPARSEETQKLPPRTGTGSRIVGNRLGHYRITGIIGEGGMGIVYEARDERLQRSVALKTLREGALDPAGERRLIREAQVSAAINHPSICQIYDIGEDSGRVYLAMERLEGEPLSERIRRGAIGLEEAMGITIGILTALDVLHSRKLVHRDLKPSNVFLTALGIKLLDFGLARPIRVSGTLDSEDPITQVGTLVGTPHYMAPEQLLGEEPDGRSDLFAAGAILFEMVSGHHAFGGTTTIQILHAVLYQEAPPLSTGIPALDEVILRALAKNRDDRYQTAEAMSAALREVGLAADAGAGQDLLPVRRPRTVQLHPATSQLSVRTLAQRPRSWLAAALLLAIAVAAVLFFKASKTSLPSGPPVHTQITFLGDATDPAISPDGQSVAYVTGKQGQEQRVMAQDLRGGPPIELAKAATFLYPKWAPDGSELDVATGPGEAPPPPWRVIVMPRFGGAERFIGNGVFTAWSPDGRQIAMANTQELQFRIVDKSTGSVKAVPLAGISFWHDLDWSAAAKALALWVELPGGKHAIWTVRPDGSRQHQIVQLEDLASPRWSPAGDAIYFLHGKEIVEICKIPIDPKTGAAAGPYTPLLSGLQLGDSFSLSANGTRLAYSRDQRYSNLWTAAFAGPDTSREMQTRALTTGTTEFRSPSVSPDGQWIAYASRGSIFKQPRGGGKPAQLTLPGSFHVDGVAWSPDGSRIAYGSDEGGAYKVWVVDADGSGRRRITGTQLSSNCGLAWSPGRQILYQRPRNRNFHLLDPDTGEEKPLVAEDVSGLMYYAKYSPDGKKVAIYWNRRLPDTPLIAKGRPYLWVISLSDNSAVPLAEKLAPAGWSPDGASIYAFSFPWPGNTLSSVTVRGGNARVLATLPGAVQDAVVTPDGKTIISNVPEEKSDVWLLENFDRGRTK